MANRSRIRKVALLLVATPFACLLIAAIVFGFLFLTFVDRWGKPTDFAAQHAALTRAHLGLGPSDSANTAAWRQIQDEVIEVHAARVPNFVSPQGVTNWPGEMFYQDATGDDVALRSQLLGDLEQRRVFERLDALALNPRVVLEPPANATLTDLSPSLGSMRQLTRFLSWRIEDAVQRGDVDGAMVDLGRIDTISRLVGSTPSLIHHLSCVSIASRVFEGAIEIAEAPTLTGEEGARLAGLVGDTKIDGLEYAFKGERLITLDTIRATIKPHVVVPIDSRSQMRKMDEMFDELDRQIKLTIDQRRADPDALGVTHRWGRLESLRFITGPIMEPSTVNALGSNDQIQVDKVGTILSIAIIRYRLDHAGELPETLDALVPTYLAELAIDPFSGKPPVYVKGPVAVPQSGAAMGEGEPAVTAPFMLYSVGYDATDNAGKLGFHPHEGLRRKGAGTDFILYPRQN